jgi:hypothetical protein
MLHIVDFFSTGSLQYALPCQQYSALSRIQGDASNVCRLSVHGRVFGASEVQAPYMQKSPANATVVWSVYVPITED